MGKAFVSGALGGSFDEAVTEEAFSQHYLSDMFAGGHVRTPRTEIKRTFGDLFPDGIERFIGYMSHKVVGFMKQRAQARADAELAAALEDWGFDLKGERVQAELSWKWNTDFILYMMAHEVAGQVRQIGGAGLASASLGDIVALAIHNFDNEGLNVVSDVDPTGELVSGGFKWRSVGDGNMNNPTQGDQEQVSASEMTRKMTLAAMKASRRELDEARAEGLEQSKEASSPSYQMPSPFAALSYIPRAQTGDANVELKWDWGNMNPAMKGAIDEAIRADIVPQLMAVAPGTWTWAGPPMTDPKTGKTAKRDLVYKESFLQAEVRYAAGLRLEVGAAFFDFAEHLAAMGHRALEEAMTTEPLYEVPIPAGVPEAPPPEGSESSESSGGDSIAGVP
jgi:hypothetical protein